MTSACSFGEEWGNNETILWQGKQITCLRLTVWGISFSVIALLVHPCLPPRSYISVSGRLIRRLELNSLLSVGHGPPSDARPCVRTPWQHQLLSTQVSIPPSFAAAGYHECLLWFCSQNVTVTSLQVASCYRCWHRLSTIMLPVLIFFIICCQ